MVVLIKELGGGAMEVIYEKGDGRIEGLTSAQAAKLYEYSKQIRGLKFHDVELDVSGEHKNPESITLYFYSRRFSDQWKRVFQSQIDRLLR